MINYDNVIVELNKRTEGWDYYFDMNTVISGDGSDLYHIIYLVWRDEIKIELYHDCLSERTTEEGVVTSCISAIKSNANDILHFYNFVIGK